MGELSNVATKLANEATELAKDIGSFDDPPTRTQLETVQDTLARLQRILNRIQGEADAWAEERESV